jgi:NADPH-dependent 2,4-dienoyl-CoA reductase/sulfur reductase-like enzyme
MIPTKHLLIGGGLASSEAAKILAAKDPGASITVVCRERHLPYDHPPLSKEFLRGEKKREEITFDPALFESGRVRAVLGNAVVEMDAGAKEAVLKGGERIRFEKALIATGGEPIRIHVPGSTLRGIHYLRTVDDAEAIKAAASSGKRACIVGAGFIGMELAASLTQLGVRVTVIEAMPHIWARFLDEGTAAFIRGYCEKRGISFHTGERVSKFEGDGRVTGVVTESGLGLECDFACVGVGIRPEVAVARAAGIDVDDGITANERLQTSRPDIYAAGDAVSFPDPVTGRRRRVEHWGHAEYSGQIAGLNMAGIDQVYDLLSYAWSEIFDLHIEFAGDETGYDRVLLRGDVEAASFTALYLTRDVVTAYLAINTDSREFPTLQKLIRRKIPLAGRNREITDGAIDLKTLL